MRFKVLFGDPMYAAVFLPTLAGMFETERAIFPIAGRRDVNRKAKLPKIGLDAFRSTFSQHEVVGGGADVIATSFQQELGDFVLLQSLRIRLHDMQGIPLDHVLVKLKQDVWEHSGIQAGGVSCGEFRLHGWTGA